MRPIWKLIHVFLKKAWTQNVFALRLSPVNVKEITCELDCCTLLADHRKHTTLQLVMTNRESLLALGAELPMPRGAESNLCACLCCNQLFVPLENLLQEWLRWHGLSEGAGLLISCHVLGLPDFCIFRAVCWSPPLSMPQQTHLWLWALVNYWFI